MYAVRIQLKSRNVKIFWPTLQRLKGHLLKFKPQYERHLTRHSINSLFVDYFSECSESIIKENYVVVYELLDEMLDNGFPLATESNILKELIKPPNILRTIANTVTGKSKLVFWYSVTWSVLWDKIRFFSSVSGTLPSGQLSAIPWRRSSVKYTNNEAYFDVIEEVDAIIDKNGQTVFAEIQGYVSANFMKIWMATIDFVIHRLTAVSNWVECPIWLFRSWIQDCLTMCPFILVCVLSVGSLNGCYRLFLLTEISDWCPTTSEPKVLSPFQFIFDTIWYSRPVNRVN